ncbi:LEA type 2 family protein [Halobacteriales archaeon Cl-PHB]
MDLRRGLAGLGFVLIALVVLVGVAFIAGVFGLPTVEDVENRFAAVNESTTVVESTLKVSNPNPFGVSLSGLAIDYSLTMNGVKMGQGRQEGVTLAAHAASIPLTTYLDNDQIPAWWYTHVEGGERTTVTVRANLSHGLLGEGVSLPRTQTIRTDVLSGFETTDTRAIDANLDMISDPVLYVNETGADWGQNVTKRQTPIRLTATVYNPKPFPYAISAVGYTVEMNDVQVGAGRTNQRILLPADRREVVHTSVVIANAKLDEWWVRHLRRGQRTNVTVDLFLLVDPPDWLPFEADEIRVDHPRLDYETTFETALFDELDEEPGEVTG